MNRIPLNSGLETPSYVDEALAQFGKNPHGEPNFRLIWSERKQIWFMGEVSPEYLYLPQPCWVLEAWTAPEKDAGPEALWGPMQEMTMGPYPRHGYFNLSKSYPDDWYPSLDYVQGVVKGIIESRNIEMKERVKAIKAAKKEKATEARQKVADALVEGQDSASMGKIQQSVGGPKNTFRTPDDWGRDAEKTQKEYAHLPKSGGKLIGDL